MNGRSAARARTWGFPLAAMLLAAAAAAQNPAPVGNLYGTALDEQGKTLPGVVVVLQGPGAAASATTASNGEFHFLNLSPGDYSVTLERSGIRTVRRDVTLDLGKNAVLMITMAVEVEAESVTVQGEAPTLDRRKTETGATFERKDLDTIPTTRDPWAILRQVPGVLVANMNVNGNASGVQSIFVGKGAHFDQNTYNLDGVAITDMASTGGTSLYFDFESLQDIEVVTGGSDPSLATPGVTLNMVTRRGTNELKGSGRVFYFFPSSEGSADQAASYGSWDYGLEAGGPLWKDHIWLWAAGARKQRPGGDGLFARRRALPSANKIHQWNAKLEAQPVPANTLTLFYNHFDKVVDGTTPARQVSSAALEPDDADLDLQGGRLAGALGEALRVRLLSYLGGDFTLTPVGGLDKQAEPRRRLRLAEQLPLLPIPPAAASGGPDRLGLLRHGQAAHELKFGFGYKHTRTDSLSVWPGDQLVANEYSQLAVVTRASQPKYEMNYYDALRGGHDPDREPDRQRRLAVRLPAGQESAVIPFPPIRSSPSASRDPYTAATRDIPITWQTVQPRVGATYAVGKDRRTLLRASYARFANQLGSEIDYSNAFPGPRYALLLLEGYQQKPPGGPERGGHVSGESGGPGTTSTRRTRPRKCPVNQISPNLKPPQTDEFIVGAERQIFSDLRPRSRTPIASREISEFPRFPPAAQPIVGVTR